MSHRVASRSVKRYVVIAALVVLAWTPAFAQDEEPTDNWEDQSPHKSGYVAVKGTKLHYLDWGGRGEALVFLPGFGATAHLFDDIAPKFTDRFRVLALTRRGHGESGKPGGGYDAKTLVEDVRRFLDALNIDRVNLAGHSAARLELTLFARTYPKKVLRLVYLDNAYYYPEYSAGLDRHDQIRPKAPRPADTSKVTLDDVRAARKFASGQVWSDAMEADLRASHIFQLDGRLATQVTRDASAEYRKTLESDATDYSHLKVPVLSIYALAGSVEEIYPSIPATTDAATRATLQKSLDALNAMKKAHAQRFKKEVARARIVFLPNTIHHLFVQRQDDVVREMRAFLLGN